LCVRGARLARHRGEVAAERHEDLARLRGQERQQLVVGGPVLRLGRNR
jgi:hypothetical protein